MKVLRHSFDGTVCHLELYLLLLQLFPQEDVSELLLRLPLCIEANSRTDHFWRETLYFDCGRRVIIRPCGSGQRYRITLVLLPHAGQEFLNVMQVLEFFAAAFMAKTLVAATASEEAHSIFSVN